MKGFMNEWINGWINQLMNKWINELKNQSCSQSITFIVIFHTTKTLLLFYDKILKHSNLSKISIVTSVFWMFYKDSSSIIYLFTLISWLIDGQANLSEKSYLPAFTSGKKIYL